MSFRKNQNVSSNTNPLSGSDNDDANYQDCSDNETDNAYDESLGSTTASLNMSRTSSKRGGSNVVSPNTRMSPRFNSSSSISSTAMAARRSPNIQSPKQRFPGNGLGSVNVVLTPAAAAVSGGNGVNSGVVLHLAKSKYRILRRVAKLCKFNVIEVDEGLEGTNDFNILWGDTVIPLDRLRKFQPWQHFNHFASMYNITRKHNLALNMGKMQRGLPQHFGFVPRSWSLKTERELFHQHYESTCACVTKDEDRQVFIMKPNSGCQGKGIVLTKDPLAEVETPEDYVVQEYVSRPLLIDNRKFDLRVYCLVTSMKHPSIMVFNEGLVRLCAEHYEEPTNENMGDTCKHLTNYAVNKKSAAYQAATSGGDNGSKRNFAWFNQYLDDNFQVEEEEEEVNNKNGSKKKNKSKKPLPTASAEMWANIDDIIVKTILSAQPKVRHAYNVLFPQASNDGYTCFEVLGFDILIDDQLKPWLMEVNHTPSFVTATAMDLQVKGSLLKEVMTVINPCSKDRMRHMMRLHKYHQNRNEEATTNVNGNEEESTAVDNNDDERAAARESASANASSNQYVRSHSGHGLWKRGGVNGSHTPRGGESDGVPSTNGVNSFYPADYHLLHQVAEDSKLVNFRRVFPVPDANPSLTGDNNASDDDVMVSEDDADEEDFDVDEEAEEEEKKTSIQPKQNPYAIGKKQHTISKKFPAFEKPQHPLYRKLPAEFLKDNQIPPCHSTMDINQRIANVYTSDRRENQRLIYSDILNYASFANAAKRDPLKHTVTNAIAAAANAAAAVEISDGQQRREEAFYPPN